MWALADSSTCPPPPATRGAGCQLEEVRMVCSPSWASDSRGPAAGLLPVTICRRLTVNLLDPPLHFATHLSG